MALRGQSIQPEAHCYEALVRHHAVFGGIRIPNRPHFANDRGGRGRKCFVWSRCSDLSSHNSATLIKYGSYDDCAFLAARHSGRGVISGSWLRVFSHDVEVTPDASNLVLGVGFDTQMSSR